MKKKRNEKRKRRANKLANKKKKNRGKIENRKKARKTTEEEERGKPRQKFTRCAKEQEGEMSCVYADRKQGGLTREASDPIPVV